MRTIDADALKQTFAEYGETAKFTQGACQQLIDNAETVDKRPQGEFTDLEKKVIADSINYLLGAELLEENGYTEKVINALKSVLQKIGAEENHLSGGAE